jgi:hypothetical protein
MELCDAMEDYIHHQPLFLMWFLRHGRHQKQERRISKKTIVMIFSLLQMKQRIEEKCEREIKEMRVKEINGYVKKRVAKHPMLSCLEAWSRNETSLPLRDAKEQNCNEQNRPPPPDTDVVCLPLSRSRNKKIHSRNDHPKVVSFICPVIPSMSLSIPMSAKKFNS